MPAAMVNQSITGKLYEPKFEQLCIFVEQQQQCRSIIASSCGTIFQVLAILPYPHQQSWKLHQNSPPRTHKMVKKTHQFSFFFPPFFSWMWHDVHATGMLWCICVVDKYLVDTCAAGVLPAAKLQMIDVERVVSCLLVHHGFGQPISHMSQNCKPHWTPLYHQVGCMNWIYVYLQANNCNTIRLSLGKEEILILRFGSFSFMTVCLLIDYCILENFIEALSPCTIRDVTEH